VVGLKPTYGAVSRYGLISMASSLDQIGPFAKSVQDCEIVFATITSKDKMDSTSVEIPKVGNLKLEIKKLRIGIPKEYFIKGMDVETEKAIKDIIKKVEALGAKIEEIRLPHTKYSLAAYYLIMPSEASANLARYDGIKYGYTSVKADNLLQLYLKSRQKGFGPEVRRRIMLGTYALSAGFYNEYYLRAQKVRTKILEDFRKAFKKVDIILTPTSPAPAFKIGEKVSNPLTMYLSDIFTVSVNLAGLPALSLPCGKAQGLPVGLQLIGNAFEEAKILKAGKIFEKLCKTI
jgi:aspartyl-tRNA(Asn)/glutamyl-tRNA(Gln) amidotransferase subunit A